MLSNPRLGPSSLKLILRSLETTNFSLTVVDFFPLQTATKIRLFREAYKKHDKLMKDAVNGQGTENLRQYYLDKVDIHKTV